MIKTEIITVNDKDMIKTYSDKNVYIINANGVLYSCAYDLIDYPKVYTETDRIIGQ